MADGAGPVPPTELSQPQHDVITLAALATGFAAVLAGQRDAVSALMVATAQAEFRCVGGFLGVKDAIDRLAGTVGLPVSLGDVEREWGVRP